MSLAWKVVSGEVHLRAGLLLVATLLRGNADESFKDYAWAMTIGLKHPHLFVEIRQFIALLGQ